MVKGLSRSRAPLLDRASKSFTEPRISWTFRAILASGRCRALEGQKVERKLAAIFAADVEGYSRLMGRDEVGTLRTLTDCRRIIDQLIAAHRGRIFNTAGDSVLADFASAVDAVQCAVSKTKSVAGSEEYRYGPFLPQRPKSRSRRYQPPCTRRMEEDNISQESFERVLLTPVKPDLKDGADILWRERDERCRSLDFMSSSPLSGNNRTFWFRGDGREVWNR